MVLLGLWFSCRVSEEISSRCYTNSESLAGDYNVILSAFEPHHTGPYSLVVDSSSRFNISPIPQEGAGMFSKTIRGVWSVHSLYCRSSSLSMRIRDLSNAMGAPSFQRYFENPVYELDLKSQASVK